MSKIMMLVVVLGLTFSASTTVLAEAIFGKVTFIGTIKEISSLKKGYQAQFRLRVSKSTCTSDKTPKNRWVSVKSGRMDGIFAHNAVNFKNAFSAVLAAFLAGKNVQIDGVPTCNTSQIIDLWRSQIGIY